MNKQDLLTNITWNFIKLDEGQEPSIRSYIQSLSEIINAIKPSSTSDNRRLEIAKTHLKEVKKHVNRLEERIELLQEQVKVLEENKEILIKEQ